MFSLPNLAPQDSHTLWYTASNSHSPQFIELNTTSFGHQTNPPSQGANTSHRRHALQRTPLARLRLDEEYMERRKQNVSSYGSSWIKPPGIPKSLSQLREEKREMEEHQEALRREALAQELAEAEANGVEDLLQGGVEEGMEEIDDGEVRDLDDEVPEAETTGLEAEDDDEEEDEENESEEVPRGLLASRMPEDVYREALVRGEQARTAGFGDDGDSMIDEEDQSQMLQEEDLVHDTRDQDGDMMDMDADLDGNIPDAETAGGYEHTDTEEELTSSDEDDSSEEGQGILRSRRVDAAPSMVRSDGTQSSMDLSSIVSRSSQIGSSPQQRAGFDRRRSRQ